ncbi:TlpA family protein disulfide reductase [Streptomyces sp. NPDC093105]|uniref:TlpA family protein disulfide reductase n=1 Tax=Streptomyces sp. NPDC093105 TaxID=3366029 RepID=UPI0038050BA2
MLVAAVVLIGCLSVFNLFLLLALARRVSASGHSGDGEYVSDAPENNLPDGSPVPEFRTHTHSGEEIDRNSVANGSVIGFLSTTCGPCVEQAPEFARMAKDFPGGRDHVLVFLKGGGPERQRMIDLLDPVARVVTEAAGSEGASASFGIVRWPSYLDVDAEGRISDRGQVAPAAPTAAASR